MFRLDHVVLLVRDLDAATRDFGGLGFQVTQGGEHESGDTHNALIAFADGTYLELISYRRPGVPTLRPEERMASWRYRGEGLVDFALVPDELEATLAGARARGLELVGPIPGGRLRPDGVRLAWELGLAGTFDLPFLCADVTPRSWRVPEGAARVHANGVSGIRRLTVGVDSLADSVWRYRTLLAVEPQPDGRTFAIDKSHVVLEPIHRREGLLEVELRADSTARLGLLPPRLAHGAAMSVVAG